MAIAGAVAMVAEPASFALAAQDIAQPVSMIAAPASFTLAAQPIALATSQTCDVAAFTVSGGDAQMALTTEGASFVLTGQAVTLTPSIAAGAASFALTGFDVQASMPCAPASFTFDAQPVAMSIGQGLDGASYTFYGAPVFQSWIIGLNVPGEPATAEYGTAEYPRAQTFSMIAAPASFTFTGQPVILTTSLEPGAFIWTTGVAEAAMSADAAEFTLTLQSLAASFDMKADTGAFLLSGQSLEPLLPLEPASFIWNALDSIGITSLEGAAFVLTGQDAFNVKWMAAEPASFALTGQDALANVSMTLERAGFTVIGWSISDVTGPSGDHIYLVEVQAHDGTQVRTFYLATEGYTSQPYDTPANQYYEPRILDPGNFDRSLFDGTALRGRARSGSGDIQIVNSDPGNGEVLDDWFNYGWSRREIRIRSLPKGQKSLAAAATLFVGKTDRISSTKPLDMITLRIGDRLADLEQPLLTDLFAGTTTSSAATVEGNADLAGKLKQRCWGNCANVPLQPANPYDLIYLASVGGAHAITVYDGGLALTADGDSASISALRAATIAAGHYRTCLATGHIRVGGLPAKVLTADVVVGATTADRTAGQIAYQMLLLYGVPSNAISTGSITVLDGLNGAECGYFVDDDRTAISAVQDVLDSIGGWMIPDRDGTLVFGRFQAPSIAPQSTFELDEVALGDSLESVDGDLPTWRVIFQYAPVFTVQNNSDLAGGVSSERRAYLAKQYRTVPGIEDDSVKTMHLSAIETTIVSYIVDPVAAATEAARQLALLSVLRQRLNVTMPLADAWPSVPGDAITLRGPRLGLASGKPFAALQRTDLYSTDTIQFALWG